MVKNDIQRKQYHAIDFFKFICAILVVSIHVAPFGQQQSKNLFFYLNFIIQGYFGMIAVPFFFVTSGFLLFKKMDKENLNISIVKRYLFKLLRLYLIWSLIYFPLKLNWFFHQKIGTFHFILTYIRDFFFVGSHIHLWYFSSLIFAVFLISVLLYKKVSLKKIFVISFIFYFIGLFGQSWFGLLVPLKNNFPQFFSILSLMQHLFVTTRNGLFEGFLFVTIGMLFAFYPISIKQKHAFMGLIFSMILLALEIFVFHYFHFVREGNMFLFLVPTVFFLFSFVYHLEFPNHPIYQALRTLSSIIFYLHMWIYSVVSKVLESIQIGLDQTFFNFIITLSITIICSILIMKLSHQQKFKWLQKLYT